MQGNAETMASNRLSYFFNLTGPSITYNTACSSSLVAIHGAVRAIQEGECRWALAGGANALLDPRYFVGFTDWGTMSPDGHCFSFDSRGNGYVRSEGAGMLVLKKLSDALASGDRVYAVIRGCGVNHDGAKAAITNPRALTQQILLEKVCEESHTDPNTISYVEAHGTGTVAGDKTEASAISGALCKKKRPHRLYIGSLKSNFGHMEGAAGVTSLIKGALCVYKGVIPATIKVIEPNTNIHWDDWQLQLPLDAQCFPDDGVVPRRVVVSSFGIGGTNACFILEQPPATPIASVESKTPDDNSCIYTLLWCGKTEASLRSIAAQLVEQWNADPSVESRQMICNALMYHRTFLPERAGIAGNAETIAVELKKFADDDPTSLVYHSSALDHSSRPVSFVFCGQGSQWMSMGSDCMSSFPVYASIMRQCDAIVQKLGGWSLLEKIHSTEVNTTRISQPATTAVQIALVEQLRVWGIVPDAVTGHSSGEIAAAYAAGAITLEEAMKLAFYRGSTIADLSGDKGGMAAVGLTADALAPYLTNYPHLVIACYNSPTALTVSGDMEEIDKLCDELKNAGIFARKLVVTNAFHSPHMMAAMPKYKDCISSIQGRPLSCRFFSSLQGHEIIDGSKLDAEYFVDNLTHPVLFPDAITALSKASPHTVVVEVGPHPTLQRPILQCLNGVDGMRSRIFGTLDRRMNGVVALMKCLVGLETAGAQTILTAPKVTGCAQDHSFTTVSLMKSSIPSSQTTSASLLVTSLLPWKTDLPHYPFERKTLWLDSEQSFRYRNPRVDHPILGVPQIAPLPTWEMDLQIEELDWLYDHTISGSCLAPGALYLDTALAAGCVVYGTTSCSLTDCCFQQALVLPNKGPVRIRTMLDPMTGEVTIYHRDEPEDVTKSFSEDEMRRWTCHFRCFAHPETDDALRAQTAELLEKAEQECVPCVSVDSLYHRMNIQGLQFGPEFKTLEAVRVGEDQGLCTIRSDVLGNQNTDGKYKVHPVLLDTIFQSLITLLSEDVGGCIPIAIHSLNFYGECKDNDKIRVFVRRAHIQGISNCGDVWLTKGKQVIVACRGVQVTPLSHPMEKNLLHDIKYCEVTSLKCTSNAKQVCCLEGSMFCCQEVPVISQSALQQVQQGQCIPQDWGNQVWVWTLSLTSDTFIQVYEHYIYPWARTLLKCCQSNIHLPPLLVVTQGACIESTHPESTSLIGFIRALHTEVPTLDLWYIDISSESEWEKAKNTLICLDTYEGYHELVYRGNSWYEPQVATATFNTPHYHEPLDGRWSLIQSQEGSLDSFNRTELQSRPMSEEDVTVRVDYVGLNYKDVMIAVGLLKEDAFAGGRSGLHIGLEASGVIEAVGKNVKDFKVGDEVFCLLDHGLATHSVTEACFTVHKPANITMEQAASLFVPYTTAYATVVSLGRVRSGMTVLIHGAAGGVGSAAIQFAHVAGATVIATCSNKKKEEYVRSLGADYVFNSRTCDFTTDVMKLTKYHGVDLILNCLSGRAMQESIQLLAPFGTFIEIGKTDAIARHCINIHNLLNNGTYIFFDMDRYFSRRQISVEWIQSMAKTVASGKILPPPTEVFTLNNIGQAIRKLSAAKHLGKILLKLRQEDGKLLPSCHQIQFKPQMLFRRDGSYLIVGGTGGLGLSVAKWMVEHGASHLLLVSRSGKIHTEDQLQFNWIKNVCEDVCIEQCDATNRKELTHCLDSWLSSRPPLVGVLHAAMVLRDGLIDTLTNDDITISLSSKVTVGWNLHDYTMAKHCPLDLFVVLSSISSIVGNLGQSNYCVGNAALEGLVYHRRALGLCGTVINLGGVYDAGAVARDGDILNSSLRDQMISKKDVLKALEVIAQRQAHLTVQSHIAHGQEDIHAAEAPYQLVVFPFDTSIKQFDSLPITRSLQWSYAASSVKTDAVLHQILQMSPAERREAVASSIKSDLSTILGVDPTTLKLDQPLASLGIDSILAVELKNRLDMQWAMNLPVFELTSGKSVGDLVNTILTHVEKQNKDEKPGTLDTVQIKDQALFSIAELLQRYEGKKTHNRSDDSLETDVMNLIKTMKMHTQIKTDYAEKFDWLTTREALETKIYLNQLPWNPYFFTQDKVTPTISNIEGFPECINYTTYDYLGLCTCDSVKAAAQKAVAEYGTSVSASRLAGGQIELHHTLEKEIADFLGVESCIVMLGGHTCNVNTLKCLMNRRDLILYDELAHNSIIEGAVYSGAARMAFRHNDVEDLQRILSDHRCDYEKVMICIEGVYSMDGDIPDLPSIISVKQRFNCILYVDEAHSIGVLGETGRGIGEHFGIDMTQVDLWMGSLGKAFASAGGYVAGSAVAIEILRYRAPGFVYSIGMPPPNAASALAAIETLKKEPWRITKLHERTDLFKRLCRELDIDIYDAMKNSSAVIPVKCGSTERCIEMMRRLRAKGVLVSAGMYPAVESGNARLRFFISANHDEAEIEKTVKAVHATLVETMDM